MARRAARAFTTLAALAFLPALAHAQCRVPAESNEAKLLAFFAAPLTFSPLAQPEPLPAGALSIGMELTYVPEPSAEIQRTSLCFLTKTESTNLSSVLPRPRLTLGLPYGFALEASYLPPVTVFDATPNMLSVALSYVHRLGAWGDTNGLSLMLRGHGTAGQVRGPITCAEDALQQSDANKPCYGSSPSRDTYKPNIAGAEAALAWASHTGRVGVYAGGGYTSLKPRFHVHFDPTGQTPDRTEVRSDLTRGALFAGASTRVMRLLQLSMQVYSVPADVTTLRVGASYRLR